MPLKDLVQAKTRLAGLLSPSERRALAQAMLEDVLAVLTTHPHIAGVTLLSDDPCAHLLADSYGATHWRESTLGCSGLNAVLACASRRLLAEHAQPLLVLHADLPLLNAGDITAALAARAACGGLVVGCDRHATGTNLLCFDAASMPSFCFGVDSCARHIAAAQAEGIVARVLQRPGIGLDVDEAQDLALLLARLGGVASGRTAALLEGTLLGARIGVALASLAGYDTAGNTEEVS